MDTLVHYQQAHYKGSSYLFFFLKKKNKYDKFKYYAINFHNLCFFFKQKKNCNKYYLKLAI